MKGKKIPISHEIKKQLTVQPFNPGSPVVINYTMYKLTNKYLYIPKYYPIEGDIIENNVYKCNINIKNEPREYQKSVIDTIYSEIIKNESCIACLYTGWGKTFAGLYISHLLGLKTLIIVNKDSLLRQWEEQIIKFTGIKPGIIQGVNKDTEPDICIGMIQSISMKDYTSNMFDEFSFTIYDETHHYCSKVFSNVFYKIGSKYNLGLTATIKRADKLEHTLNWFLGQVAVNIKLLIIEPQINVYNFFEHPTNTIKFLHNGKINTPASITSIIENNDRDKFILDIIKDCYASDRNILFLTDRKAHCDKFYKMLSEFSVGIYYGGMKIDQLKKSNDCKIILATYQMASEGYDNPKLDTLILASPKGNVEQAVGRILRRKNKNPALVIDIHDCISIFNNWNKKRLSFYKSNRFKIENKNDNINEEPILETIDKCMIED